MDIQTIATIILILAIGCYALHLFLVFRQITRQTSGLNLYSTRSDLPSLTESGEELHKIVHASAEPGETPRNEENQEKA